MAALQQEANHVPHRDPTREGGGTYHRSAAYKMNTAVATFTVTEMAVDQAREIERTRQTFLASVIVDSAPQWVLAGLVFIARGFIVKRIENAARQYAERAVWFEGALARLHLDGTETPEAMQNAVACLEELEFHVQKVRGSTLGLLPHGEVLGIEKNVTRLLCALADLYEAVTTLRSAVMEMEADADIKAGRVQTFHSGQKLLQSLKA